MAQKYYTGTKLKTLLSGDKVLGRNLIRKARAYTGYLFDQLTENQKYRTQQWNDPDGSKIQVFVWRDSLGERAVARIYAPSTVDGSLLAFTLLFEAGMIQVVNEGGGVTSTLLHLGEPVSASYDPSADLNDDAAVTADDRLFPVGQITYTSDEGNITTPIVGDIVPSSYTPTASRVATTSTQKANLLLCPASLFSGKLRLYVQALYGTGRRDVRAYLANPGVSAWPTLQASSFTISYRSRNSAFLVTTSDYRYFLATVYFNDDESRIEVRFYEMVRYTGDEALDASLSAWALNELREEYPGQAGTHGGDDAKNILETLVLAQLKPSNTEHSHIYLDYPGSDFDFGSPLEYGWHAKWDGSEARIVLITTDSLSYGWGGQTVQLEIGHSLGEGGLVSFTADAAVVGSGTGEIQNDLFVWIPNGTHQTTTGSWLTSIYMCGIADPENATVIPNPPAGYTNVPLYGWFDNDNEWREVTLSRQLQGATYSAHGFPGYVCHGSSEQDVSFTGNTASTKYTLNIPGDSIFSQTSGTFGHDIGTHTVKSGAAVKAISQLKYNTLSYHLCQSAPFPGWEDGVPELGYWFSYNHGIFELTISRVRDYTSAARVALVVAHNDCEAVVGVHKDVVNVSSVAYGNGQIENTTSSSGRKYTAVHKKDPLDGPEPGEELWTGVSNRYTTSCATAQQDPSWSYTTKYNVSRKRVRAVLASRAMTASVADYQVGINTFDDDTQWDGGVYDLPSPHGASYGTVDADWEAFTEAPWGVCSEGVRDISLQPSIMVSAVFNSYLGDGTPEDIQNLGNDGFSAGHSFVGWA